MIFVYALYTGGGPNGSCMSLCTSVNKIFIPTMVNKYITNDLNFCKHYIGDTASPLLLHCSLYTSGVYSISSMENNLM